MKAKILLKSWHLVFFMGVLFVFNSCAKDGDFQEAERSSEDMCIQIKVKGFVDAQDVQIGKPALRASADGRAVPSKNSQLIGLGDNSFAEVSFGNQFQKNRLRLLAQNGVNSLVSAGNDVAVFPMETGTKYIVLVFDENDTHQSTTLVTLGAQDMIRIPKPANLETGSLTRSYRFVAFSYNTKSETDFQEVLASLQPDQSNNQPQVRIPLDKQFLYCNVQHDLDFSANKLVNQPSDPISFVLHEQRSKVGVIIDGKSMFSKVKKVEGQFEGLLTHTATMDLKGNAITDRVEDNSQSMQFSYKDRSQDTLAIYRYTVAPSPNMTVTDFRINLTSLELSRESIQKVLVTSSSPRTFLFAPFEMDQGVQSVARVHLFEGFQVGAGANAKLWSLANLYHDPTATDGQSFKIRANAFDGMRLSTDYFRFNRLNPISIDDQLRSNNTGDPCSQVYPLGTWRLPTNADINNFISASGSYSMTVYDAKDGDELGNRYDYIQYENNGQSIRFYTLGRREAGLFSYEGIRAEFWTSDDRILRFLSLVSGGETYASNSPSVGSGLALNIRCVRDR